MNESVVKELKKYIFFSSIGEFIREIGGLIILIILLVIFITNISGILDMIRSEDNMLGKIIFCVIVLFPVFGIVHYCLVVSAPKRIIRRLEEEGELSNVIMDFQEGEKLFGDAVRVGNKYIIGKGNDGTKDICQLPRNGAGEQTVRQLIMYICTKNPNIKVGYK